jgi:hypothetical protein
LNKYDHRREFERNKLALSEVNNKLDLLLVEKDTRELMVLGEKSLKNFLQKEPDVYLLKDIKTKIKHY